MDFWLFTHTVEKNYRLGNETVKRLQNIHIFLFVKMFTARS